MSKPKINLTRKSNHNSLSFSLRNITFLLCCNISNDVAKSRHNKYASIMSQFYEIKLIPQIIRPSVGLISCVLLVTYMIFNQLLMTLLFLNQLFV